MQATHPSKPEQLLDALAGTKRPLSDSELMPPPPAPSLYNQLLDHRPQKRPRTDAQSSRAVGPSPTKFKDYGSPKPSKHHSHKTGTPSKSGKQNKHRSPYKKVVSSSSSNRKHPSTVPGPSKTVPTPSEILALADKEEFNAAKTLASLMQSKKSPMISHSLPAQRGSKRKAPGSRGSSVASGSSGPQQPSSQPPGAGGGRDEAAGLLLLLANSPSPVRASQGRRRGPEPAARVLYSDSITSPKANSSGGGSIASSSVSMLLPPPSPLRPGSISGDPTLDPPPVRDDPFFSTPGGGVGTSLFPPTTPGTAKFNIADFMHFTPTPAYPASPVRSGGGAASGAGMGMGMGMPPGAQLSPIASVRRANGGAKERKESASLVRRTSNEELGKAKESPLTSGASVKSVGSDAERPPSSAVSTIADDR